MMSPTMPWEDIRAMEMANGSLPSAEVITRDPKRLQIIINLPTLLPNYEEYFKITDILTTDQKNRLEEARVEIPRLSKIFCQQEDDQYMKFLMIQHLRPCLEATL